MWKYLSNRGFHNLGFPKCTNKPIDDAANDQSSAEIKHSNLALRKIWQEVEQYDRSWHNVLGTELILVRFERRDDVPYTLNG